MTQHFYTVWPASAMNSALCNAPVCAQRNVSHLASPQQVAPTGSGYVLLPMSITTIKKIACFMSGLNLSRTAHRYSFQRPTFSDLVLTTTANLKQTCPNQHFPVPDQSQLTDLQSRLNTVNKRNSYRCKKNNV